MAMTAAERQRRHRRNNRDKKDMYRIHLWFHRDARIALKNLSRHYDKSQSELIQALLLKMERKILDDLYGNQEAWDRYWEAGISTDKNKAKGED